MNNNLLKKKFKEASDLIFTSQYLKNYEKLYKKHKTKTLDKLLKIINELKTFSISTQYHNHILSDGKTYELHVEKDILLLYRYEGKNLYIDLILLDLTNHKQLSKKLEDGLDTNLNEEIEKHDELNPLLFENDKLKDDVKEAIEKIAEEFIKELKNDNIKFYLEDIILVGSNVSYNYTKDSDLDIHLIASSDELRCPDNLYPLLYSAYRSIFNKNYDLTIKGIPAEIYVEMDKPTGKSNGIYSLYNGWLKHPIQEDIPELDQEAFDKLFTEWENKYFDLINSLDTDTDLLTEDETAKNELIIYNASNNSNFSDLSKSKELGIHCGTLSAAKEVKNREKYSHIYKLTISNPKIIKADQDYEAIWDVIQIIANNDSLLKDLSDDEKKNLLNNCRSIDYPNKYQRRGALLRDILIRKGYNLIEYINQIEDKGSKSYIILDPKIITNIEEISDE